MKYLSALTLSLIMIVTSLPAQSSLDTSVTGKKTTDYYQFYIEKADKQLKAGKFILIAGTVLASTGLIITVSSFSGFLTSGNNQRSNNTLNAGGVLGYTGLGLMAVSIPILVSGMKNKRKAKYYFSVASLQTPPSIRLNEKLWNAGISLTF